MPYEFFAFYFLLSTSCLLSFQFLVSFLCWWWVHQLDRLVLVWLVSEVVVKVLCSDQISLKCLAVCGNLGFLSVHRH
jgi:hypothetical protein